MSRHMQSERKQEGECKDRGENKRGQMLWGTRPKTSQRLYSLTRTRPCLEGTTSIVQGRSVESKGMLMTYFGL